MTTLYNTTGQQVTVYATDGRTVWGGTSAPTPDPVVPVTPPTGPALNIATALSAGNNGATVAGGTTGTMVATDHTLTVDVATATFAWVSTYGYAYDQGATFRTAVTINGGPLIPVTVGGQATWRREKIANGEVATTTSDPITLNARAGSTMRVHMWAAADGSGQITADLIRQQLTDKASTGDWDTALAGLKDVSWPGGWAYRPARVVAPTDKTSWLLVGDSILQGNWSYLDRAATARGLAAVKSAQGGEAHVYFPGRWNERCAQHVPTAPYMIDQYGVNSPGKMPTAGLGFWSHAKANGVKYLVKTTIAPTTSQGAPTMSHADAQKDNAWLRDGAPLTADKKTALETGTTDPTAVRCDVVRPDGTIKKGTGGHPVNVVSDTAARIESSPGYLSDEAAAVIGGDKLHPSPAVHAMLADRLARDLGILGF